MKTVKRILAVVFLMLLIWAVGYLVYTGSRLFSNNSNAQEYKGTSYQTDNMECYFDITDTLNARITTNGEVKELTFKSFEEGILTLLDGEQEYVLAAIPEGFYDLQLRQIFGRVVE
jgi:hypothetical protein